MRDSLLVDQSETVEEPRCCAECGVEWSAFNEWYGGPHCPPGRSLANALGHEPRVDIRASRDVR